jgi:hypothetical protein
MTTRHRLLRPLLVARAILPIALALGCRAPATESPRVDPVRPLAEYAGRRVVVLPLQSLDDGAAWSAAGGGPTGIRTRMDDELAFAFTERGLAGRWILPAALAGMTRRAGTFIPDVRALAVEPLRRRKEIPDGSLADPLASQLRSLVAFTDARWVLLPIEGRIERVTGGNSARVVVQLAMIDARGATVAWIGEVAGDTASAPGARPFASVAGRAADLIVPGS